MYDVCIFFFILPPRGFDPQSLDAVSRQICPQDHGAPLLYLKLTRVDLGNVSKKGKIWKVLILEVFLLVGFNRTLSIYLPGIICIFLRVTLKRWRAEVINAPVPVQTHNNLQVFRGSFVWIFQHIVLGWIFQIFWCVICCVFRPAFRCLQHLNSFKEQAKYEKTHFFVHFQMFFVDFSRDHWKRFNIDKKGWKRLKKSSSTSWSKYTTVVHSTSCRLFLCP